MEGNVYRLRQLTVRPLVCIGGYVLFIAAALLAWYLLSNAHEEIGRLEADIRTQQQETREAKDSNDMLVSTVDTLESANERLVSQRKADAEQRESELAERNRQLLAANNLAAEERRKRNELMHRTPDCDELAKTVVSSACPDMAGELRRRTGRIRGVQAKDRDSP